MKRLPFDRGYPEDQQTLFDANQKFVAVMEETKRRFRMPERGWGDRVGVGSVYAVGRLSKFSGMLNTWNWRWRSEKSFPSYLDAMYFDDNPAHMGGGASFAERLAGAVAFAEAANAVFAPEDGEFRARALELVAASESRPAGIYPGGDADVVAIDRMLGQANHKVIDRLTRAIWEGTRAAAALAG